jgi:aerobic carbon-monoxide dehydrogenase small subunit
MIVSLTVNGEPRTAEVAGFESLLWVLRERLGLRGAKDACLQGECGSCSVVLDGALVCSCLVLAADAEGSEVTTVEGLGDASSPHPVQSAFVAHGAAQCGYCTPGLVVALAHLRDTRPDATPDDVREALAGNLCRCTGYGSILRAAADVLGHGDPGAGPVGDPGDQRSRGDGEVSA